MPCNHDDVSAIEPIKLTSDYQGDYARSPWQIPGLLLTPWMTVEAWLTSLPCLSFLSIKYGKFVNIVLSFIDWCEYWAEDKRRVYLIPGIQSIGGKFLNLLSSKPTPGSFYFPDSTWPCMCISFSLFILKVIKIWHTTKYSQRVLIHHANAIIYSYLLDLSPLCTHAEERKPRGFTMPWGSS